MDYIKEKLYQQLAIDYCCQVSDIKDDKNSFIPDVKNVLSSLLSFSTLTQFAIPLIGPLQ